MSKLKFFFHSLHRLLNPFRFHPANLLLAFSITWIYILLVVWITAPWVETGTFSQPEPWLTNLRFALLVPGFIFMVYHLIHHMDFLEGFRFLFYPLLAFSLASWFFVIALGGGSTASGLVLIFLFPMMGVILPVSFIVGFVLDVPIFISYFKRKKKQL